MNRPAGCCGLLVILMLILVPVAGSATGISLGVSFCTLDLEAMLDRIPIAVDAALLPIGSALGDPNALDPLRDEILATIAAVRAASPDLLIDAFPLPLIGASLEFGLPLIVVDTLRISAAGLSNEWVWGILDLAGLDVPEWPITASFDDPAFQASFTAAPTFGALFLSTEVAKRIDLLLIGVEIAAGVDLVQGAIDPDLEITTSDFQMEIDEALEALQLDALNWSAFAFHSSFGVGIGPPFLRLTAAIRFLVPVIQSQGWWQIGVSSFAGSIGLAVRF